jgi:hypothetical protein
MTGSRPASSRGLTTDQVWAVLVWVVPAIAVLLSKMPINDLAYGIRAGQLMLDGTTILRVDPFTFTVFGTAWHDQQWGAQIALHIASLPLGWAGLVLLRAAIVASAFGVTFRATRRGTGDSMSAALLTLGGLVVAILMPGTLALRAQLLAVPLFLLTTWILRRRAGHPVSLVWLIPITVVWANLHGSFILVPVLTTIAFAADLMERADTRRWTGPVAVLSALAAMANPWGYGIYGYVAGLTTAPIVREVIDEWRPLWRLFPAGPAFLAALVAIVILYVRGRLRRPTLEEGLGLVTFGLLAIASGRNVLWACLYVPPVLGAMWVRHAAREPDRSPMGAVVVALLCTLLIVGTVKVVTTDPAEGLLEEAPLGVTAALREVARPDSRVFDGWWGSWFIEAAPEIPMFVDARAELFPQQIWDDYFAISDARGDWRARLDRWGIDVIVAAPDHQARLLEVLAGEPDWTEVYRDADGSIFVREGL